MASLQCSNRLGFSFSLPRLDQNRRATSSTPADQDNDRDINHTIELCGNPMAVDLFSRNCMVQNNYPTGTMIVDAIRCPGGSEVIRVEIPPEKHKYIRYSDLHIQYNKCAIAVSVYLEGASGDEKKSLLPSMIWDNEKIELNYMEGRVTVSPIKGNMIAMNG